MPRVDVADTSVKRPIRLLRAAEVAEESTAASEPVDVASSEVVLEARGIRKEFGRGGVVAVDGVDLSIRRGETLALVGESGSGKTTFGRIVVGLESATSGTVELDGRDAIGRRGKVRRDVRRKLQMVFQDPFGSLDPRLTVRQLLREPFSIARVPRRDSDRTVHKLLRGVGLSEQVLNRRPHEFSGGQRQRIAVARAIALNPSVVVLDEPVSALDVSVQAQTVNMLLELQRTYRTSFLFIAHDLAVVRAVSDRVAVMYLGRIVEEAPVLQLFAEPRHPYTQALLAAIPEPDPEAVVRTGRMLTGSTPSPSAIPGGCRFHLRCPMAALLGSSLPEDATTVTERGTRVPRRCVESDPQLRDAADGKVACHFPDESLASWQEESLAIASAPSSTHPPKGTQ
jgi:oligopeptide/dipeptide ABC transporter ATP-binding protein